MSFETEHNSQDDKNSDLLQGPFRDVVEAEPGTDRQQACLEYLSIVLDKYRAGALDVPSLAYSIAALAQFPELFEDTEYESIVSMAGELELPIRQQSGKLNVSQLTSAIEALQQKRLGSS